MSGWSEKDYADHMAKFQTPLPKSAVQQVAEVTARVLPKPSKYRNVKTVTADGVCCDSKKEAARWETLKLMHTHGGIRDLLPHPSFPLYVNGTRTGRMTFDALYTRDGQLICEDTKSAITAKATSYRQRLKVFQACYPHIAVREHIA